MDKSIEKEESCDKGLFFYDRARYHQAIICFARAIKLDPYLVIFHFNYACVFGALEKYDQVVMKYEHFLISDPYCSHSYYNLAKVLHIQKKYEEAIAKYKKTLEINPSHDKVCNCLGVLLYEQQKYDEAIVYFEKVIKINFNDTLGYINWGLTLYQKQQKSQGDQLFLKAIHMWDENTKLEMRETAICKNETKKKSLLKSADESRRHHVEIEIIAFEGFLKLLDEKIKEGNEL